MRANSSLIKIINSRICGEIAVGFPLAPGDIQAVTVNGNLECRRRLTEGKPLTLAANDFKRIALLI